MVVGASQPHLRGTDRQARCRASARTAPSGLWGQPRGFSRVAAREGHANEDKLSRNMVIKDRLSYATFVRRGITLVAGETVISGTVEVSLFHLRHHLFRSSRTNLAASVWIPERRPHERGTVPNPMERQMTKQFLLTAKSVRL